MTSVITAVPREHVGNIWHVVSPWLDKAIARTHGRYHNVDILTSVIEGTASLWIALTKSEPQEIIGSLIFTVSLYPSGMRVGRIDYIAGRDRDVWFEDMWQAIKNYARIEGCQAIEMVARRGTAAYVKEWGGREVGLFYEYDLTKEEKEDGR
jgi:hypothetical protein